MSEKEKSAGELLKEKLVYKKKTAFEKCPDDKNAAYAYCEDYKKFLDNGKTERDATAYSIGLAKAHGFREYKLGMKVKAGDKFYYDNRGKSLYLFIIGSEDIENGIAITAAHIDSPRLDIKANPVYEAGGMAFIKTHYYGGIKKYQWTAIPLALHGMVTLSDGKTVDVIIGENDDDPLFYVNDILPHLANDQYQKHVGDAIEGEQLNLLSGSVPFDNETSEAIKLNLLKLLNDKYGMTEYDFQAAELSAVPAYKARDIGLDRSLIAAYGHDDKVCAYPEITAILSLEHTKKTVMSILADKEETGSNGNTGMKTSAFCDIIADISASLGKNERIVRSNSVCLSADVAAAYDPNFAGAYEINNSALINSGIALCKYTGARGKSDTNDASGEYVGKIRKIFDDNNVVWQSCELGKVDQGGGGTVAKYISEKNIDTVDVGVPVISMHAPYEVVSKLDVYNMHKAVVAFYTAE